MINECTYLLRKRPVTTEVLGPPTEGDDCLKTGTARHRSVQMRSDRFIDIMTAIRLLVKFGGATLLLLLASTQLAMAQQPSGSPEQAGNVIRQLSKRVEELEARLKELEARQVAAVPVAVSSPSAEVKAPTEEPNGSPVEESGERREHVADSGMPSLQVRGFADVEYRAGGVQGGRNSFALGQLNLFVTSQLSEKLSVLGEFVFETDLDNKIDVGLGRMLLQYSASERLKLNFGRFDTAIGYFNTAHHHGSWFVTTIDRPLLFAFEDKGGLLPIHSVGVSAEGSIPSGRLGLHYIAEVGSGHTSRALLDLKEKKLIDLNNSLALNIALLARPEWAPGLQLGVSAYHDRISPAGLPELGQTITSAHVVYRNRTIEFLNEAIVIRHTQGDSRRTVNTPGFYTQVSRKFGRCQPFLRYQYVNAPRDSPIFSDVGLRQGPAVGIRYDFNEFAAFKVQYEHLTRRSQSSINKLGLQLSFNF